MRSLLGVLHVFGSLLAWFGLFFLLPILTAIIYGEFGALPGFVIGALISVLAGLLLRALGARYRYDLCLLYTSRCV